MGNSSILIQKKSSWLTKVETYILTQLSRQRHVVISDLSSEMNLSERQFFRKMEKLTGKTPNRFVQEVRMHKARQILESGCFDNIKSVAAEVGFTDPVYFSRLFYRFFARQPSSYTNKRSKMAR